MSSHGAAQALHKISFRLDSLDISYEGLHGGFYNSYMIVSTLYFRRYGIVSKVMQDFEEQEYKRILPLNCVQYPPFVRFSE